MAVMGDIMSDENDDDISPYLRRPIRSLMEYLREVAQRRKQEQDRRDQAGESNRPQDTTENGHRGKEE